MALLQWKPSYALGIPSVDLEHRELISLINETYAQLDSAAAPDAVEACLEDIYATISSHFALEERHMREAGYREFAAHKQDHEALLDEIRDLMDAFADDAESGRAALQQGLGAWFSRHFATFDARLHEALR